MKRKQMHENETDNTMTRRVCKCVCWVINEGLLFVGYKICECMPAQDNLNVPFHILSRSNRNRQINTRRARFSIQTKIEYKEYDCLSKGFICSTHRKKRFTNCKLVLL